ncbi:putative Universal stress protein [Gammaproteobacteria bacterium]
MIPCRRILCVIDPDARGEQILTQAVAYARQHGADWVAAHVVDHHTGFESDHIPFLTPMELNLELAAAAAERIAAMLKRIHDATGPLLIEIGPARATVLKMARLLEVDLVMVGSHSSYGLVTRAPFSDPEKLPFAVITLQARRSWNPLRLLRMESFGTSTARHLPV